VKFFPAARVSAATSVLFLIVYNACNWLTKIRPDVQVWAFAWEEKIPVIPWMVVPYWSLDLFFVCGPFLCADRGELRALGWRLSAAILAGGLCFLIVPLVYAFPRPHVDGIFGPLFQVLQGMDAPHNLMPSLHITLRTIVAAHYTRHTRGWLRAVIHVWFSLIGVSTLFTHQHHVVDIAGGFLLAGAVMQLIPATGVAARTPGNRRVGFYYATGALACLFAAYAGRWWCPWWPLAALLFWPAFSLGMVACGCFGLGASIYRKRNGRLSWLTRVLLGPVRFGQWLSLLHYRKQSAPWDALTANVWLGSLPDDAGARQAVESGVTAVLDLTCEFSASGHFLNVRYLNVPVLDLTAPVPVQLAEAVAFIERESATGIVFIHCKAGYSRTAAAAGAWLLASGKARDAAEAIAMMKQARPGLVVRPEVKEALEEFGKG
jgi:membrane-associated phospholipid phosphatase